MRQPLILAGCSLLCLLFSCTHKPMSEDLARETATHEMEAYCRNFKVDLSLLQGPYKYSVGNTLYAYEWVNSNPLGRIQVIVTISKEGYAGTSLGDGSDQRLHERFLHNTAKRR